MGTRNLTCVLIDGEFKVAQYGQWDGYPEGQGKTALEFLLSQSPDDYEKFKAAVRQCRWATDEDWSAWNKYAGIPEGAGWINMEQAAKLNEVAPQVSRDHGAKILNLQFGLLVLASNPTATGMQVTNVVVSLVTLSYLVYQYGVYGEGRVP